MNISKEDLIREAYKKSEDRIQAQLTVALAADGRALTFSGLLFAAAAILAGLSNGSTHSSALLVVAIVLVLAALVAGWSAKPVSFAVPGGSFKSFEKDIENGDDILSVISQLGKFNDENISDNDTVLDRNGKLMRLSFCLAALSAPAGLIWNFWAG